MVWALLLSSVAAGLIATSIMVFFLYLPLAWGGNYYDVFGAIGSFVSRRDDARSRFVGGLLYYLGGLIFSLLYGWVVLALMGLPNPVAQLSIFPGLPVTINLFYPLLGVAIGLGHGILAAFFAVIFFIEHHPLETYRTRFILVISQLISHVAFGVAVMFFHHQFLQLLLGTSG
jgi:hypothetical protein